MAPAPGANDVGYRAEQRAGQGRGREAVQNYRRRPAWRALADANARKLSRTKTLARLDARARDKTFLSSGAAYFSTSPSLNLIEAWLPLQKGLLEEIPQRQSVTRFRFS